MCADRSSNASPRVSPISIRQPVCRDCPWVILSRDPIDRGSGPSKKAPGAANRWSPALIAEYAFRLPCAKKPTRRHVSSVNVPSSWQAKPRRRPKRSARRKSLPSRRRAKRGASAAPRMFSARQLPQASALRSTSRSCPRCPSSRPFHFPGIPACCRAGFTFLWGAAPSCYCFPSSTGAGRWAA